MTARIPAAVAVFVCVVATGLPCNGQGILPSELARTACDTRSSGFNIAIAGGFSADRPIETAGYAYPIITTLARAWLSRRAEAMKKAGMGVFE